MAWPHYRAASSRVLEHLELGGAAAQIWRRDGTLRRTAAADPIPSGTEDLSIISTKLRKRSGIEGYSNSSGFGLKSKQAAPDLSPWNLGQRSYGGCKNLHSSSTDRSPEPTAARTASVSASHLEAVDADHAMHGAFTRAEDDELQLENGALLYSKIKSTELLTTLLNLQLVSFEPLVDLSMKVLTSPLMRSRVLSAPVFWTVKQTAYSHFCAGEDATEAAVTLTRMWELGLKGILDYSLEDAEDNKACDQNCSEFLNTIHHTRSLPDGSVSFACVKVSAICPISLLERVSDLLRWQHKNPEFKLPWKQDGLPILAVDSPTYQTQVAPDALTAEEERDLVRGQERLSKLCEACAARNLPLLVDAEYSTIQPAIDYITYAAAFEFNKGGTSIVYNTLQTYLKDAPSRLSLAWTEASRRKSSLALKLVRGAYITREKALALSVRAPSPIHHSIQDTHRCYDSCVSLILERVASTDSAAIMLATHNADSGRFAAKKAIELGIDKKDVRVQFAQLKGMSDSLSLALARGGFNVSKYLPFGPVAQAIPYLVRRAEENRGLLGNTKADCQHLRAELVRRLRSAAVGFNGGSAVGNG